MMNLTKVPAQKTQLCFMLCVKERGCETQLVVLGVNVAFHADDADTPICCASQTICLVISPIYDQLCLVFPCSLCLQSVCLIV
jgi:hypothetical protein